MLIDYTYFEQDPTYIAGIDVKSGCTPTGAAQEIVRNVESCIRRYEPKFLRMLLGIYVAENIDKYPEIAAKIANTDTKQSPIAKYIYFYYLREHVAFNSMAGEKIKMTDNSRAASPWYRLVPLWNEMVDECHQLAGSLCGETDVKPDYSSDIFEKINRFGL